MGFKLCCDKRFTHAFTACGWVFKEITLVGSNYYFENATACSKRTLKTTVATQLYLPLCILIALSTCQILQLQVMLFSKTTKKKIQRKKWFDFFYIFIQLFG
jgi:hypothetical protein